MEGELAKLRAEQQRDALRLGDLHEMPLDGDRSLRSLHLGDLDADDLRRDLRLRLRCDVPRSGDRGATAKAVTMAPMVAMRFMVFSRLVVLMSREYERHRSVSFALVTLRMSPPLHTEAAAGVAIGTSLPDT